jgi:DNA-binding PadR family transcriptional regulator
MKMNPTAAAVVAYLRAGPMSGWDVAHGLDAFIGEFWNVTQSQVYRELRSLLENGAVERGAVGPRDRQEYRLTSAGRAAFDAWMNEVPDADNVRIPLLLKLYMAEGVEDAVLRGWVDAHRATHAARLAKYEVALADVGDAMPMQSHVLRYGIHHERAVLAWIETLPWSKTTSRRR